MNEERITPPQDRTQETPVAVPVSPPPGSDGIAGGDSPPGKKSSALKWIALGVALFALVLALIPFATFGSGFFIVAGLILSIVALAKSQGSKGVAVTALILSLVAVPAAITMSIVSIGLISVAATSLDSALIEQQITSGISEQLGIDATVTCPGIMIGSEGSTFECDAVDSSGDSVIVDVTVTDSSGDVTWEIRS